MGRCWTLPTLPFRPNEDRDRVSAGREPLHPVYGPGEDRNQVPIMSLVTHGRLRPVYGLGEDPSRRALCD